MKVFAIVGVFLFAAALALGESAVVHSKITPVTGESWLHHIGRSFDETSMGKTWQLGPPFPGINDAAPPLIMPPIAHSNNSNIQLETLHGSELYRINCRGCHGKSGLGAPSEIPSLIDPVRASSADLVGQRMRKLGMEMSRRQIAQLANQSRGALLSRLHDGGRDMPSFGHLNELEIGSLLAYLNQLADVPGASKDGAGSKGTAIRESPIRIGELIVKSTCHLCHAATGKNPTPAEMSAGAIPPLSAIPTRVDQAQLVRKVTRGATVLMGSPASPYRGRMPVFNYLTEDEAADVYQYLTQYPPEELGIFNRSAQATIGGTPNPPPSSANLTEQAEANQHTALSRSPRPGENPQSIFLPAGMTLFAVVLTSMCWIILHEFRRLSTGAVVTTNPQREETCRAAWFRVRSPGDLITDASGARVESSTKSLSPWVDERKIS